MKRVHIIGAGGPAGIGLSRSLEDHYKVTGEDSGQWSSLMQEVDSKVSEADMVISVPDSLVHLSSFKPPKGQLDICQDKAKTAKLLGDLAPKVYWVRDTVGAGAKGAQMASEFLPGDNFSQEFVFFNGEKIGEFQKKRVSYLVKQREPDVRRVGSSAVSICTNVSSIRRRAEEALNKLAGETGTLLNGFYGIDFKYDADNVPKITEINAGRLLTASYSFFWLTGYNLPLVGVKAYLDEDAPLLPDYPLGYGIVRQIDQLPRLCTPEETRNWEKDTIQQSGLPYLPSTSAGLSLEVSDVTLGGSLNSGSI